MDDVLAAALLMSNWRRLIVAGGLAGLLVACGPTFPEHLPALQADPMGSLELPGASVERRSENDADTGLMNKPAKAKILTVFSVHPDTDPEAVREAAIDEAEAAGWFLDDVNADVVQGTKTLSTGEAEIAIYFSVDYSGPEPVIQTDELIVLLEHDWGPNRTR
jgi:hypothetical protein